MLPRPLLAALLLLPLPATAQQRRPVTAEDLYAFTWVADPRISPDGKQVAYVHVAVNAKRDGYETSIWTVPADASGAPRRLTAGPHDAAPRWSPDSRTLAFVRSREKSSPQIYLLSLGGGEGVALTDLPKGASAPVWSPDGHTIAFTSTTEPGDSTADSTADSSAARKDSTRAESTAASNGGAVARDTTRGEPASDVHIVTRAIYRFNGVGYLDPTRHEHVWTVPVEQGGARPAKARQVTTGDVDAGDLAWSPDGKRIYLTADTVRESYYFDPDANLYAVPATGGAMETVIDIHGPVAGAVPSPDGSAFAFAGFLDPRAPRSYDQPDLFVFRGGRATNLTADYDYDIGGGLNSDQHPPRGGEGSSPLVWSADGKSVYVVTTEQGTTNLLRFDATTGRRAAVTTGHHDIYAYDAMPDASRFVLAIADPTHIGDLFLLDPASGKLTQLTHANDELLSRLALSDVEAFWYRSFDGQRVQGWVMKPPGFDAARRYPMILEIHGGPHTAYGWAFMHEFQLLAAQGYVVLFTNPRGSTSYGQAFGNIIQYRYPGDDYKDLMVAVDTLVRRGTVDPQRLGVTGGSGGGLLTNWIVTQTDRFVAAVSQRSVASWIGFWYTADFTLFRPTWFRSTPFEDPQEFIRRSPVAYAARIKTPLMLIAGEQDLRTPPGQGAEAMFRALKFQRKPAVMVVFPRETHELSRSGEPKHRVERLAHIGGWFDRYLKGGRHPEYDVR